MLRHATIPTDRGWFTWSSLPAEMVFLPLGVRLTPVAYAGSTGKATLFPSGRSVRFGAHALDARHVSLDLHHAGTHLVWTYDKTDSFGIVGAWEALTLGEWGLRFWVNLCLSAEDGACAGLDAASGAVTVRIGSRFVALIGAEAPVQVTGHATVEAVAADYEAHGYFPRVAIGRRPRPRAALQSRNDPARPFRPGGRRPAGSRDHAGSRPA